MLTETLAAVASAGGTAVVQAAGTDLWTAMRGRVAALLGRDDQEQQRAVLVRLDRTAAELEQAGNCDETQRMRLEVSWRTRFEDFLDGLPAEEQAEAAARLDQIAALGSLAHGGAVTGQRGLAVDGDMDIRADRGSVASGVLNIEGGLSLGNPR